MVYPLNSCGPPGNTRVVVVRLTGFVDDRKIGEEDMQSALSFRVVSRAAVDREAIASDFVAWQRCMIALRPSGGNHPLTNLLTRAKP